MSWLLLGLSLVGAWLTLTAFRPPRHHLVSVPAWVAGWLTSELPLHHLAVQAAGAAGLVLAGALEAWPGRVGLVLALPSWIGLVVLHRRAGRADEVMEAALVEALGPDYRHRIRPGLLEESEGPVVTWRRLLVPFVTRDPDVEKVRDVVFATDGRLRLRLDVYRPRDGATGRPVLVFVHGGAWVLGDKREQGLPMLLHLAAHGWVCLSVNYRLSPRATFPDQLVDVKRALAWARDHVAGYGGDPRFVVVSGGSAGGHLAALAALTPGDREYQPGFEDADTSVAACVPFYGVYDFTNRDGVGHAGMGRLLARMVMKSSLDEAREDWEKASPMDRVGQQAPPFLVVHGANDTLVPVAEARLFVRRLRAASPSPVAYAELPGAQHAFEVFRSTRAAHAVLAVERFLAWVYSEWLERTEAAVTER